MLLEPGRKVASLVVPAVGRLVQVGDPVQPYRVTDADGQEVDAVSDFLKDLRARDLSMETLKSYGRALLRWAALPVGGRAPMGASQPDGGPGLRAVAPTGPQTRLASTGGRPAARFSEHRHREAVRGHGIRTEDYPTRARAGGRSGGVLRCR